jgi:NAD+ kinase
MKADGEIAVYGGSFNPPGKHHRRVVEGLGRFFDSVVVVPYGPRADKPATEGVAPVYRAAMCDLAFKGLPHAEVDLFDLEQHTFTSAGDLQKRYAHCGRVWHVIGSDFITGGADGRSLIQRYWRPELWSTLNFAIVRREGFNCRPQDFPPNHRVLDIVLDGSSADLRERLFRGEEVISGLTAEVVDFIRRHRLYQGGPPARSVHYNLAEPRLLIVADERNHKAAAWAEEFSRHSNPANPNCILVIGGDGTMLRAIQHHWRLRIPFFGVNAGHLGFLLNNAEEVLGGKFPPAKMISRPMPLLHVDMETRDGKWRRGLTFNDAWIERSTSQTSWLEVKVDGHLRLPKLICDGLLVSTAAGSTAYARSMGATPLLADTPAWMIVGSNVMHPPRWKSALLSLDSHIEVRSLSKEKRPLKGIMYGMEVGEVIAMKARISRIAAIELAFCPNHDIAKKFDILQFPPDLPGEFSSL